MRAMQLKQPTSVKNDPLDEVNLEIPTPGPSQVLLKIQVCGVCHTDLHIVEGDLDLPHLPTVPGHQVVGLVEAVGDQGDAA